MKNKAIRLNFFNMIEVVLAMAIIAFGMTSILGLFPVGLNALKASMAENSCSDAIDQVNGYLKNQAEFSPAIYHGLFTDATALPTAKPATINSKTLDKNTADFLTAYNAPCDADCLKSPGWCSGHPKQCSGINFGVNPCTCMTAYPKVFADWNIYRTDAGTNSTSVYFVIQGSTNTKAYDYAAMILVWRTPVIYYTRNPGPPAVWAAVTDSTYGYFAGLNFEISWPLQKPYAEREKRYYYIEVKSP